MTLESDIMELSRRFPGAITLTWTDESTMLATIDMRKVRENGKPIRSSQEPPKPQERERVASNGNGASEDSGDGEYKDLKSRILMALKKGSEKGMRLSAIADALEISPRTYLVDPLEELRKEKKVSLHGWFYRIKEGKR